MSDNKNDKVPMEFPGNDNVKKIDPIVDVVEKELNPPKSADVQQIISNNKTTTVR